MSAALPVGFVLGHAGASESASSSVVHGAVDATGRATGDSAAWGVEHPARGVYRLEFEGGGARVEIERWDAIADATVVPLGDGTEVVRFRDDTGPVDTSFSFTAVVRPESP